MANPKDSKNEMSVSVNFDTTPILYTDNVHMSVNAHGVTIDITQRIGNQLRIVARIGMSREHATQFAKELGKLLMVTEGSGKTDKKN